MAISAQSDNYNYSDYPLPHGVINGVAVPFFTTPEYRTELKEKFQLRPESDVFIVTYPKSGTTWMQNIIRTMILSGDTPEFSAMTLSERIPYIDYPPGMPLSELEGWPSPRAFKCHNNSPAELDELMFNGDRSAKIIYVLRDPRDTAVSLYHHMKKASVSKFMTDGPTFEEFYKMCVRDRNVVYYGLWEDHVNNWLSKREEYNMLVVRYEDMIADSSGEINRVAKFLDLNLPETKIQWIADQTSFSNLTTGKLFKDQSGVTESVLRKGVVGDWKNSFTDLGEAEKMGKLAEDIYNKYQL